MIRMTVSIKNDKQSLIYPYRWLSEDGNGTYRITINRNYLEKMY